MIAKAAEEGGDDLNNLDVSGIAFPSDNLSIRVLRKVHPKLFDKGTLAEQPLFFLDPYGKAGREVEDVGSMLYCEREVAAHAYANALGVKGPDSEIGDVHEELATHYARYGIASGTHHAAELVRGIESQAAQVAKHKPR